VETSRELQVASGSIESIKQKISENTSEIFCSRITSPSSSTAQTTSSRLDYDADNPASSKAVAPLHSIEKSLAQHARVSFPPI
jgi:hypothetical protein